MRFAATRSSTSFGSGGPADAGAGWARGASTPAAAAVTRSAPQVTNHRRVTFAIAVLPWGGIFEPPRSEEHTSELQSQSNLVCRLLLEKKKITTRFTYIPWPSEKSRMLTKHHTDNCS